MDIVNPFNFGGNINNPDGYTDISVALHIIYFGLEFRFKLNELFDFIIGFTTLDILNDDNGKNGNPSNLR